MRERVRESERGRGREFSVFISNLPSSLDQYGLAGICQKAGAISDIYIPPRQGSQKTGRFGFVRFFRLEDARRCIALFNRGRVRGMRIFVSMARPKKQDHSRRLARSRGRPRFVGVRTGWRKKAQGTLQKVFRSDLEEEDVMKVKVIGQPNVDFEEWLARTLVCTTEEPRDLATLESAMLEGLGQPFKLRALSCVQFLLTLPSELIMSEVLKQQAELEQWFVDIKKWGMADCCDTRRVWLEVLGVPPHGWNWENFKGIAELWGKFICLGKSTLNTDSFETMRVLIATSVFQRIEAEIILSVGYGGYRVMVREVETISQILRTGRLAKHDQGKVLVNEQSNNHSNSEVPGFEDLENLVSNQRQSEGEESLKNQKRLVPFSNSNLVEDERSPSIKDSSYKEGVRSDTRTVSRDKSISGKDNEPPQGNECSPHVAQGSRTKSVSFSQNGYSTEVFKLGQLSQTELNNGFNEESTMALGVDLDSVQQSSFDEEPPGFERGAVYQSIHDQMPDVDVEKTPLDPFTSKAGATLVLESNSPLLAQPKARCLFQQPSDLVNDQGVFQNQLMDDVTSIPPGFEGNTKVRLSADRRGRTSKNNAHFFEGRVTRSQSRQRKESASISKRSKTRRVSGLEGRRESPCGSNSGDTTASMRKVAEDALEIGELLGLKVVAHKENAIKRITQSLKSARVLKSNH